MDRDVPISEVRDAPKLDASILPIYQKYKQENQSWIPDFDTWSYLNLRADFDLAAAFTQLFWPDFVEVDGCVILQRSYSPEAFSYWMGHFSGDRRAVESMLNHVHVWDLFLNSPKDVNYPGQLLEFLANALIFGWKQVLLDAFPNRSFVFTIRNDNGTEISFHQEHSDNIDSN